jgi:hypothetical protein
MSEQASEFSTTHPDMLHNEVSGNTTFWPDGTTTYTLVTKEGHATGWTVADEADTVLRAIEAIRSGKRPADAELWRYMTDTRRLLTRLQAVQDELLLLAREADEQGNVMSWREIGEAVGQHFTTVRERHERITVGEQPAVWRGWLTQHTERATRYTGGLYPPAADTRQP